MTNVFHKILNGSNCKQNKIWLDHNSSFFNRSIKLRLVKNNIKMYSTHNEGKSFVIYKYMPLVSKYVYIDNLENTINKCNNTYYSTIKKKLVDVKSNTCINSYEEINNKGPKFKNGYTVKISKHKNIFVKGYVPNWP